MLVAVHPWDIDGASRAGLVTAWLNRSGGPYPSTSVPLSGQVCKSVGGWSAGGVAEVEAGGAVEGVFGETGEGAGGQDGVFVPVFAGQVHREAPTGG